MRLGMKFGAVALLLGLCIGCAHHSTARAGDSDPFDEPGWYNGERVQIHTRARIHRKRLPPQDDIFWQLPAQVKRIGANVSVRHIKGSCEGVWWPSAVGQMDEVAAQFEGDLAEHLIGSAHAQGIKQIVYYRHFCDKWAMEHRPDWIVRDRSGAPVVKQGHDRPYPYMSLASPFADYAITHMSELAQRGADGFYFDEIHTGREGDFSEFAQHRYREQYGRDLLSVDEREVQRFRQQLIAEFIGRAVDTLHEINPDIVTLMSVNTVNLDNLRIADAPKYEDSFNNWLGGLESTATVLSDVGEGYPHMWRGPAEQDSLYTAARYMTFGAIYNRDIREREFFSVPHDLHNEYRDLFELSRKISPAMADVKPYRFARVLLNGEFPVRQVPLDGQIVDRWRELIAARIPAGYLSLGQISESGIPADTQVLVVPEGNGWEAPMDLSPSVKSALTEFEKGGGLVLWSEDLDEGGWLKTIKDRPVPIVAKGGEENLGMAVYRNSDGTKYVINISAHHSKDVTLSLSSEFFKNPVSAHENVSGQELEIRKSATGQWEINLLEIETMAQVVVSLE